MFSRIAGLAGLSFVVLVGSANIVLGAAGQHFAGAALDEVNEFHTQQQSFVALASSIAVLAWMALALFGVGAFTVLWARERALGDSWSLVGLMGIAMQNAIFPGVVASQLASGRAGSGEALAAMWDFHQALFALNGASLAIALIGFSLAGRRTGVLRAWHWALGLAAAILMSASALLAPLNVGGDSTPPAGLPGFILWLIFIAAFAVALLRGEIQSREQTNPEDTSIPRAGYQAVTLE